jgi:iron(III) transport system permease protein
MSKIKFIVNNLFNPWVFFSLLVSISISIPIMSLMTNLVLNYSESWNTIISQDIWHYIFNSLIIIVFQSIFVIFFGVSTAWIVTIYNFPLRNFFRFALLLPFSIPTYVAAIVYAGLFDYSGDFQMYLRNTLNIDFNFPNIRSLPGVIYIFSITLYPYVYIISRAAFSEVSKSYNEVGKTLGFNSTNIFFKVFLPLTSFAILGGVILSVLESLNDFGTVQFFGVDTFTTAIYKTWIGLGEIETAAQLSIFFLFFVSLIFFLHRRFISLKKVNLNTNIFYEFKSIQTSKVKGLFFFIICLIPVLLGFIIPFIFLVTWTLQLWDLNLIKISLVNSFNSVSLALIATFFIISLSLLINYSLRIKATKLNIFFKNISSLGYAMPGSVIAIGVIVPFIFLDDFLINFFQINLNTSLSSFFSGSVFVLIFAYIVRFFTISQTNIENGLYRIPMSVDNTATTLGKKPFFILCNVHIPIMAMSIILTSILIFIEVIKELSATLILRPFNFDTLAIQVYEYASEEKIIESSVPSLMIVVLCIIGIIFISKINKILFLGAK